MKSIRVMEGRRAYGSLGMEKEMKVSEKFNAVISD